ncbi:MAG: Hsp20/alpha crystallin family protein [Pseudomonadota bacterium]
MSDHGKKGFGGVRHEIDLRLDGLFGELGKVIGEAMEHLEDGASEIRRSQEFQTKNGPVRAEAGVRVRMGGRAFPSTDNTQDATQPFSRFSEQKSKAMAPRPITATILEEAGLWSLTADLPGMTQDDLRLDVSAGTLKITAAAHDRRYEDTFDLPHGLSKDDLQVSLRNGILDLTAKIDPEADA